MTAPAISQAAIDLIIASEVTDRATYERSYAKPTRPAGDSGVTIGIGYDLGQVSAGQFRADWAGHLTTAEMNRLAACCGVQGAPAEPLARSLADLSIPWEAAVAVFSGVSLPAYTAATVAAIPGADRLPPDCLGALVSLAYNRGEAGFTKNDDRRREMRAIRAAIIDGHPEAVPAQFRAMKRLWAGLPGLAGLLTRRDAEADLFERGLNAAPAPPAPTPAPVAAPIPVHAVGDAEARGG